MDKKPDLKHLRQEVNSCKKCGSDFGNSSIGFGKIDSPMIFFIGMNPWVKNHEFRNGRGITRLIAHLEQWEFNDFYFDNIVKCEMPDKSKPSDAVAEQCIKYLLTQINIIKPKKLLVFGSFAKRHINNCKFPLQVLSMPHFSSVLYRPDSYSIQYYKTLKKILSI